MDLYNIRHRLLMEEFCHKFEYLQHPSNINRDYKTVFYYFFKT